MSLKSDQLELGFSIVEIPMGTNCAPLVADLFLLCYERDFMKSLSDAKQADILHPDIWMIF